MLKRSSIIIVLLVLIIGWQGYQLYGNRKGAEKEYYSNDNYGVDSLFEKLKNKFDRDSESSGDIFDRYFNDDFFSRHSDPFKEMEEWHSKIMKRFDSYNKHIFGRSWDDWYSGKFGTEDIEVKTKESDDKITMEINIPGLKNNSINIDINENRIKIDCDIKEIHERKDDEDMKYFKSSSHRHFSRILPLPENADADKADIKTKKNKVIIIFPKIS